MERFGDFMRSWPKRLLNNIDNRWRHIFLKLRYLLPTLAFTAMLACSHEVQAQNIGDPRTVYKALLEEEANVSHAIERGDKTTLDVAAERLGSIVDVSQDRVYSGGKASECEIAAMSLANVAIAVGTALAKRDDFAPVLIDGMASSATDFKSDMANCEIQLHEAGRDHLVVEKAYMQFRTKLKGSGAFH